MIKKAFCIIILFFSISYSQVELKDKLLNYDFDRLKISISARSMILDFVRQSDFDSVWVIVSFCDSVNYPDSAWLSKRERFLIKFLEGDTAFLFNKDVYIENFDLVDTIDNYPRQDYHRDYYYYTSHKYLMERAAYVRDKFQNFNVNFNVENVERILYLLAKEKKDEIYQNLPNSGELWDFLEIILSYQNRKHEDVPMLSEKYLEKYPDSKFKSLIIYNFAKRYKKGVHGGVFILKGRYDFLPQKTNSWIEDYPSFALELGYMFKSLTLTGSICFGIANAKSSLIYGTDTLNDTMNIDPFKFNHSIGYTFDIRQKLFITPAMVLVIHAPWPIDKAGYDSDFKIPTTYGCGFSLCIDKATRPSKANYSRSVVHANVGIVYNDMTDVRKDLDNWFVFIEIGYGYKGWSRVRDYSF